MDLTITDVQIEFKDGVLKFLRDKKNPVMIQSYNINDSEQADILVNQVRAIMKNGLASVFGANGIQSEVRSFSKKAVVNADDQTMKNLLEEYIRRVNLVHRFEQEMSKYDALKELMEQISYRG